MDVETEIVRITDHRVRFGVSSDEGEGDEWPSILEKVLAADIICIGTPIWFGVRGSRRADGDRAARRHLQRHATRSASTRSTTRWGASS